MSFLKRRQEMIESFAKQGQDISNRMTGITTSIALSAIGFAMRNVGMSIRITKNTTRLNEFSDHDPGKAGQDNLFRTILETIEKLNLEGFKIDHKHKTITYNLK